MASKKIRKTAVAVTKGAVEVIENPKTQGMAEPKKTTGKAPRARKLKAVATATPESNYYCVIDHPVNGEIVSGLSYAIRMGASDIPDAHVEVQINGGPWNTARYTDGYWWFDWGYYLPGPHKIQARIVDQAGNIIKKSAIVKCQVE